jgi:hypothetical protein
MPYREAQVKVTKGNNALWTLTTKNVRRFGLYTYPTLQFPTGGIVVDGQAFNPSLPTLPTHFCKYGTYLFCHLSNVV